MFKEGQQWRCRDKRIVLIYRVLQGVEKPIVALDGTKIIRYSEDGAYLRMKDHHPLDLIGLYKDVE